MFKYVNTHTIIEFLEFWLEFVEFLVNTTVKKKYKQIPSS